MKRGIFLLVIVLALFGCFKGKENSINTLKSVTLNNGKTLEKYVNDNIIGGEVYQLNDSEIFLEKELITLRKLQNKDKILNFLEERRVVIPESIVEAEWKLEEENKDKKVIIAFNDNIKVEIKIEKNKKEIDSQNILTYDKTNGKAISQKELDRAIEIYNIAKKYEYSGFDYYLEYSRFNEKNILENKENLYTVRYYPSGRIKYLSDGEVIKIDFRDESYLKEIDKTLDKIDREIDLEKKDINTLINLTYLVEYQIIGEKLNKKLSEEDRKKIEKLEEKGNRVFDKLQIEIDNLEDF